MSRRKNRPTMAPMPVHDGMDQLAVMGARDDLLAVADHLPDLTACLATGGGGALTGMPGGDGETPLPYDVTVADLLREIRQHTEYLERALLDVGMLITASTTPGKLRQAAYEVHQLATDARIAVELWDAAKDLRQRTEECLGTKVRPDWLGPCPTLGCDADVYLAPGREVGTCHGCGADVTRTWQAEHAAWAIGDRLMTLSELTSALKVAGVEVPYETVRSWSRSIRGKQPRLPEHIDDAQWHEEWLGIPFVAPPATSGLYPFALAWELALARHGARLVKGSTAA